MINSDPEGYGDPGEVNRDHEALKFTHQAPADQRSHAEHEHGNDKGQQTTTLADRMLSDLCCQAGVIDDMMEDVLDAQEDEEIEEEADAEVDKVLSDLTDGKLGQAGTVGTELPVCCFPSALIPC